MENLARDDFDRIATGGPCRTRTDDLSRVNRFDPLSITWDYPENPVQTAMT